MFHLNRVMIAGTLVGSPEVRYTREGRAVVFLRVWVPGDSKPPLEGFQEGVEVKVLAVGPQGERWAQGVKAGDNVFIEGVLVQRSRKGEVGERRELALWAKRITLIKGGEDG